MIDESFIKQLKYKFSDFPTSEKCGIVKLQNGQHFLVDCDNKSNRRRKCIIFLNSREIVKSEIVGFWHTHSWSFFPSFQDIFRFILLFKKYKKNISIIITPNYFFYLNIYPLKVEIRKYR